MYVTRPERKLDIESDFFDFMKQISAISLDEDGDKDKRPDFAWRDQLLIEVKTLRVNPNQKIEKILEPEKELEDWPIAFGILGNQHFQNTDILARNRAEMRLRIQSAIRNHIGKANKQFLTYQSNFSEKKETLLVLLNEDIKHYQPVMVLDAVRREIASAKNDPQRTPYESTESIIYLTEAHYDVIDRPPFAAYPITQYFNENVDNNTHSSLKIAKLWSLRGSSPPLSVFRGDGSKTPGTINIIPERMKQSDYWRHEYRKSPYLRSYSHNKLLDEFTRVTILNVLAGVKRSPSHGKRQLSDNLIPTTHLFEEISLRGIDLRHFVPKSKHIRRTIDRLRLSDEEREWLKSTFKFQFGERTSDYYGDRTS
ncbi:hypothetical protein JQU17_10180 [Ponticoccus sp. SC2-23]|uniref:hypothetical protein n=1 Tax=Alexandriicola marinus TaxID=2081710 RepID=UPI000FD8C2AF|nr:hypothetical protein [Alexandriicola marinus]MBM1219942.1 hypothetical protein [Ponticoccus sp. SC6-9]MBM1224628.1 hypothetical protein [Ponticoccus sp. SC6-15]MBM1228141.1 hypothetical protein [Ponticoccus sp. SC6-38]MBM1234221.1 hypothetical protein [Ponticoccus sp. SC6-45]MBM1238643.1 hypothetical protein [Ponticoccus sp. SC6-49]MBM1242424.1 hypothetical protein [Ponticoccus sp. SC2-64]MBM1247745.1 hypothetical protein [Ponticoccus sp. SC6-42]MBM1251596.1 hypothetical protein [Pontico